MLSNWLAHVPPDSCSGGADRAKKLAICVIRIMHVITGLDVGGAEVMLQKLIEHSDRYRFEHIVISLMDLGIIGERLKKLGVEVHALGGPRGYPTWRVIRGLMMLARQTRPTIVQGWMYHGNLAAWLVQRFAAGTPPMIWGIRQSLGQLSDEKRLTQLVIRASALVSATVDTVVYNAQRSRVQHEAAGFSGRSSMVIPNGFDTARYIPSFSAKADLCGELELPDDVFLIGLIGRFHPMKDHRGFLDAVTEVARRHNKVRVLMVGEGVSWSNPELSGWVRERRLEDHVYLLGRRDDVPRITAALDVAVSASARNEGFANVIGEAMSCGVPCIVTDVGDSASIVSDTGSVVPPGNPSRLAAAICEFVELTSGEREQMGLSARARVVSEFSVEKIIGRFEALYSKIAEGRVSQQPIA